MKKFKVGDRVGLIVSEEPDYYSKTGVKTVKLRYDQEGDGPQVGVVTEVLSDGKLFIRWDDEYLNKESKAIDPNQVAPEPDVEKIYSELEEEFFAVEKEIKAKLKEAGKIIAESHQLAKKTGHKLVEIYGATGGLESAMNKAGWRTSSWGC